MRVTIRHRGLFRLQTTKQCLRIAIVLTTSNVPLRSCRFVIKYSVRHANPSRPWRRYCSTTTSKHLSSKHLCIRFLWYVIISFAIRQPWSVSFLHSDPFNKIGRTEFYKHLNTVSLLILSIRLLRV